MATNAAFGRTSYGEIEVKISGNDDEGHPDISSRVFNSFGRCDEKEALDIIFLHLNYARIFSHLYYPNEHKLTKYKVANILKTDLGLDLVNFWINFDIVTYLP